MATISLCMIVKNEEQVLGRALDCGARFADEIVVVDTGSTDNTPAIAREYTDKVFHWEWRDDFAAARNYAFSLGTMDLLMWLDADDLIDEENLEKLLQLKESIEPEVDVAMLRYNIAHDSRGRVTFSYYRERLVRRERGFQWLEPVHEHLSVWGEIREYDIAVTHGDKPREGLSTRNLDIYQRRREQRLPFSPRATYYYARELSTHSRYREAVAEYRAFLAMADIWQEDAIWASADLSDCLRALGERDAALDALFLSFTRDLPRAEILCRIGEIYLEREELQKAIFWYAFALEVPKPAGWGFVSGEYWDYIPHMQLCVLYDRTGQPEKALEHHRAAKVLKPEEEAVRYNEEYFTKLLGQEQMDG